VDGHNQQNSTQPVETAKLEARHEGHVVATAAVECSPEPHGTAKIALERHADDIPAEVESELVDRVLDSPGVSNSDGVHVVLPLGDAASITRLQDRTTGFSARAAGASSVIDAEIPAPGAER
jgi:hypothetical protein